MKRRQIMAVGIFYGSNGGATKGVAEMIKDELGDLAPIYQELKEIKEMKGIQMRMPTHIDF